MPKVRGVISKTKIKKRSVKSWHTILDDKQRAWFREVYSACARCGHPNIQVSHIYPKGTYQGMRYDPVNILPMCFYCHKPFWHDNPLEAWKWFIDKYPDRYAYLQEAIKVFVKRDQSYYEKVNKAMDEKNSRDLMIVDPQLILPINTSS